MASTKRRHLRYEKASLNPTEALASNSSFHACVWIMHCEATKRHVKMTQLRNDQTGGGARRLRDANTKKNANNINTHMQDIQNSRSPWRMRRWRARSWPPSRRRGRGSPRPGCSSCSPAASCGTGPVPDRSCSVLLMRGGGVGVANVAIRGMSTAERYLQQKNSTADTITT